MPTIDVTEIIALPGHPGMFARRVAVEAWEEAGSPPVNSAGRLYAEQKHLYVGWRKRLPGFNPADNPDDETQRLAHVRFVAFDIDPTADRIRRLTAAGFVRPYTYEPWHWELPNVRSYAIVRSIPATASLGLELIEIEKEEDDDMKIYAPAAGGSWVVAGPGVWRSIPSGYAGAAEAAFGTHIALDATAFDLARKVCLNEPYGPNLPVDTVVQPFDAAAIAEAVVKALPSGNGPTAAEIASAVIDATAAQYDK